MRIFITGASGFVGSAVVRHLSKSPSVELIAAIRNVNVAVPDNVAVFKIKGLDSQQDWHDALVGTDVVLHCAARVHVMKESAADPLAEFRRINVEGTLKLARQAAEAGVKRFIFLSSIKVNGEETYVCKAFYADQFPNPIDSYGISKMEAEQGLGKLASETGMEVVIIRPPLTYGPGVRANFRAMMCMIAKGIPLPLGDIRNKRSLVALDNLVDFIITCIDHPKAANQIFLVSDGEDLSTTELLRKTAKAMGKKSLLFPVPVSLMRFAAGLIGKAAVANRLFGSLQVNSSKARELLDWKPVITMEEQLKKTVDAFLNEKTI